MATTFNAGKKYRFSAKKYLSDREYVDGTEEGARAVAADGRLMAMVDGKGYIEHEGKVWGPIGAVYCDEVIETPGIELRVDIDNLKDKTLKDITVEGLMMSILMDHGY